MAAFVGAPLMMWMILAAAAALAASGQAPERAAPQAGAAVTLEGCVKPGVEARCLVVTSGGWLYDVTGLGLSVGDYLNGSATVSDKVGVCMQGVAVKDYRPDKAGPKPKACPRDLIAHPAPK
jgi:hypothetical protein